MHPDCELALRAGEDARAAALRLGRAHETFVSSHSMPSFVRSVVAGSWERCAAAGSSQDGRRLPPIRAQERHLDDVNVCIEEVLTGLVPARLVVTF